MDQAGSGVAIKVGMLVSFDYQYIYNSLPRIYALSDSITLAVDHQCRTWTGNTFEIEPSFWQWIEQIDTQKKIRIYRDDFFRPELSALENDSRERNMLGAAMGDGGWHVQVDSDEYFIDYPGFVNYLKAHADWTKPGASPIDIGAFLIPMYKKTEDGFLIIPNSPETIVLATNKPAYVAARRSKHVIKYTPFYLFHQTWARSEEEIGFKINNWGHITDFDKDSYFTFWKKLDKHNYTTYKNFHPLRPSLWGRLEYIEGRDIDTFIANYLKKYPATVSSLLLVKKRLGQLYRKLTNAH